eukprot:1881356-Pleurochrysis_carterae.AAC.1
MANYTVRLCVNAHEQASRRASFSLRARTHPLVALCIRKFVHRRASACISAQTCKREGVKACVRGACVQAQACACRWRVCECVCVRERADACVSVQMRAWACRCVRERADACVSVQMRA